MSINVLVPVSVGELLDKISILEIKQARLTDDTHVKYVQRELQMLSEIRNRDVERMSGLSALVQQLRSLNEQLWDAEDLLREHEKRGDFGATFVQLARSVYHLNDLRYAAKADINRWSNSLIREQKSYGGSH